MSLQNCSIIEDRAKPNHHIIIIIFEDFFLIFGYLLVEMYFIFLYVVVSSLLCDCSARESYRNGWHFTILNLYFSFFSFPSNLSFFYMLHKNALIIICVVGLFLFFHSFIHSNDGRRSRPPLTMGANVTATPAVATPRPAYATADAATSGRTSGSATMAITNETPAKISASNVAAGVQLQEFW